MSLFKGAIMPAYEWDIKETEVKRINPVMLGVGKKVFIVKEGKVLEGIVKMYHQQTDVSITGPANGTNPFKEGEFPQDGVYMLKKESIYNR